MIWRQEIKYTATVTIRVKDNDRSTAKALRVRLIETRTGKRIKFISLPTVQALKDRALYLYKNGAELA